MLDNENSSIANSACGPSELIKIIKMIAPEFKNLSDGEIGLWIDFVSPMVSKKKFGKLYSQAIAYLVCHHMKLFEASSSGSSAVSLLPSISDSLRMSSISAGKTSISLGSGSISAGGGSSGAADYALTPYGLRFLEIRRLVIVPITNVGCGNLDY